MYSSTNYPPTLNKWRFLAVNPLVLAVFMCNTKLDQNTSQNFYRATISVGGEPMDCINSS